MSRGQDLWNLGILGAKCRDADRAKAGPVAQGKRQVQVSNDDPQDRGPARLAIEALFPEGPAEKAGLRIGDVIIGIGSASFEKAGSLGLLHKMLVAAESGKGKGVVPLRVVRTGEKGAKVIKVPVPQGGKPAAKPLTGEARTALIDGALAWLAKRQKDDGGFAETLSGNNGAVVQTALAGLCWLADGSDLENGRYSENVAKAAEFVAQNAGRAGAMGGAMSERAGANWDQTNWGLAHGAIFLGELYQRTPTEEMQSTLLEFGKQLAERQEESGGWAHGPGGKNALGYLELNIVTGLALGGLGLAGQAGYDVPPEVIAKAEKYLRASGGGGGVGYSHKGGGGNIGRTAGCFLGFVSLGRGREAWCKTMRGYVEKNTGKVLGGHASLMQHILLAGVAGNAIGGKAEKTFWAACERDLILARAPDGSFQSRPWHESISMQSNSDVSFGQVWTTAAWTLCLASKPEKKGRARPGLPAWMGLSKGKKKR
jgi:hypothetical protein